MFRKFKTNPMDGGGNAPAARAQHIVPLGDQTDCDAVASPALNPPVVPASAAGGEAPRRSAKTELKVRMHQKVLGVINVGAIEDLSRSEFLQQLRTVVRDLLQKDSVVMNAGEFEQFVEELVDELLGLGPLEPLLQDPTVSDILVNTHDQVYVERSGKLELTDTHFQDEKHLIRIIQRIVARVGRRVDESQPWVDARLEDGSRINALIPPCAVDGALLSIRKFSKRPFSLDRLVEGGALTPAIAEMLKQVVRGRLNVIVAGSTGSGKTTMLNALSGFIGDAERILTVEDTAELQLQQSHVGRLETRPANLEGQGEVTIRDLIKNALRMRPDRIVVGEVRGEEVIDMLQAMNTGHDGSMTTLHANSPRDALTRLESMICMSGIDFPLKALRNQIASAVDVVVQLQRLSDGTRRVTSVQEVVGMEGDVVTMQEIFSFRRDGLDEDGRVIGQHIATGVRPRFAETLRAQGLHLSEDLFDPGR